MKNLNKFARIIYKLKDYLLAFFFGFLIILVMTTIALLIYTLTMKF